MMTHGDGRMIHKSMLRPFLVALFIFLPSTLPALPRPEATTIDYSLEVSFDIASSKIKGVATIPVKKGRTITLDIGRLNLIDVSLDQEEIGVSRQQETVRILSPREGTIEIRYEGTFRGVDHPEETSSVIGGQGIFLTGTWYPRPDQMCIYHLRAKLPDGFEAISEAETIEKIRENGHTVIAFDFPHPLDSISLIASDRYKIVKNHFNGVDIFAYFFREDSHLIPAYIERTKRYLRLYNDLISRFPYKRFSIVENFLPTGYSMPTFTLLGQAVVRLPFILETSLGHEILHQWFGNSVYIEYRKGNWAEGLTTYLADHLYEEEKGRGSEYRKGALIDYMSYVNDKNEFPLKDFQGRTDDASKAIGYGKALMMFQALKNMVGQERFYESIRYFTAEMRFRKASWEDIRRAFEKYCRKDLTWFFNQWIDGKGLAELDLEDIEVKPWNNKFEVAFTILQKKRVYAVDLSVTLSSYRDKVKNLLHLQKERERFKMIIDDLPERILIDENYDIPRMLSMSEFPPVIARLIGDERPTLVRPPSGAGIYDEVIHAFREKGARVSGPDAVEEVDLKTSSLVLLGADNPLVRKLYGDLPTRGGFSVVIKENPWDSRKVVGVFDARSEEEVKAAFQKVFHYGKYSAVSFDRGLNVYKKIDETMGGIAKELLKQATAVDISTLKPLPYVIERVADKRIVYVGETHDQFSHHTVELEIIKGLYRRGRKVAIGMEMFQRPFQKAMDDYIEGKTDEREFLKTTEYFKRWGFDYNFYRPILQFARAEKIPVVALNVKQEIAEKVFRGGLDSLSEEEREFLPFQMDFSDPVYKERLKKVFGEHEDFKTKNFDFFYQAQILWDEAMSESIDKFLRTHSTHQMVVLAGSGHLAYGSGIPKRTARRNGYDYAIVLNDAELEKDIADYVLLPEKIPGVTSPKLMVFLLDEKGRVEITGFPHGSISEKAGMKVGDVILSIDHTPVSGIDDVKIELLSKEKGERANVRVLRETTTGSPEEMVFEVNLQ